MTSHNLSFESQSQKNIENTHDFLSIYEKSIYVNNYVDKYWNFIGYYNPIEDIDIEIDSDDEEDYIDDMNYYEDYIKK